MSEQVRTALAAVIDGRTLTQDEARLAMGAVMDGEATPSQLAALLVALRMRGETVEELAGFAGAMRERVVPVQAPAGTIDIVGTGGDGSGTFNISTTAALVVAACGVPVAKHGNRAITSQSGSADVLDALGIRIAPDAASAGEALRAHGFAFLFAPNYHPAMRHAGPTRREIGVRTAFNLLGPLTNPAGATRGLIGVGDEAAAPKIAEVLRLLGAERMLVVHGAGVDELTLDGTGVIYDVTPEGIERRTVDPGVLGLSPAKTAAIGGADPATNARLVESVLQGEPGARRDVVLLNAGAALVAAGVVDRIEDGIDRAALTIDAGLGTALLKELRAERKTAEAAAAAAAKAAKAAKAAEAASATDATDATDATKADGSAAAGTGSTGSPT
jgi:anthranilate phosphoribosyltransferase